MQGQVAFATTVRQSFQAVMTHRLPSGGTTTGEWLSEELVLIGLLIKSFGPFEQHAGVHFQFGQRPICTIGQRKRHAHSIPCWIDFHGERDPVR